MNALSFNVCPAGKALLVSIKDSDGLLLVDPESLVILKTFSDANKFAPNTLAVAESLKCFITFSQHKSVFSFWQFSGVA
jgi:hypothetical protein